MGVPFLLSEPQMRRIEPFFPLSHGIPRVDDRRIISGIVYVIIPMTRPMIDAIVEAYANAARACEEWGLDGLEIHCAHGYLPAQFLSPLTNRRTDEYGGSFENRSRFLLEVMQAVRGAVSADFAVGIRAGSDLDPYGLPPRDVIRTIALLEERGLIDFVDLSMGDTARSLRKIVGAMHEPTGYELEANREISRSTRLPTIVTGRFRTLEEADQVIRAGDADLVGMTRAHIADPDIVRKTMAGAANQVRPCIACNQGCLAGFMAAPHVMGCTVNPAVGREAHLAEEALSPASLPRKILVVGGGPAGMECARIARMRGHDVVLAEAGPNLGGAARIGALAPTRHTIGDIAGWLQEEVYRLGVDVRLSCYVEIEDILAEKPDAVVVATGSAPRMDGVQLSHYSEPVRGIDQAHVLSSWDALLNPLPSHVKTAVVIDDLGHYEAVAVAEHLATSGVAVTFVTRHDAFAPLMEAAEVNDAALTRLSRFDVTVMVRTRAVEILTDTVLVHPTYSALDTNNLDSVPADLVVFVSHNAPNSSLVAECTAAGIPVRAIGDALSPRQLQVAIREGRMAGAEL